MGTILVIGTFDTKEEEIIFIKERIEKAGHGCLLVDAGILSDPNYRVDVSRHEVAAAAGIEDLAALAATGDKGRCIRTMIEGAALKVKALYKEGRFDGAIAIGGGQGTDIGCSALRTLPWGVPKLVVSTIASGRATFGPYVGTRDMTMMHSIADIQGINFLTARILSNAAGAICGMVESLERPYRLPERIPVAISMLGTTTPGALRAKKLLERKGFEVTAFHQNGTGGIAMEELIEEGAFRGVLDLNLHEIGDREFGGLHGAIRPTRLEAAGMLGIPQVIAPGSIYYTVQGPLEGLPEELKRRKYIVHNPNMTLVRLSKEEMERVALVTAQKINKAKGPVKVFLPLRGMAYPDREGLPHWEPETNQRFFQVLKKNLRSDIPVEELDHHINDSPFIDRVVEEFLKMMGKGP